MARNIFALLLIVLLSRPGWSGPSDEVDDALAKAEALYFEAQFAESIKVLVQVDELLRAHPERRLESMRDFTAATGLRVIGEFTRWVLLD